ncbi:hypothetical protein PCS77_18400, partial [Acinetobacter baumannii]|uniref:hypothetical protein n=1 Tax=Acinetobacter baumannii TaxID=470 RepID=UPI0022DD572C|nr:hypothetical protein [Acinetobacter baumannii]
IIKRKVTGFQGARFARSLGPNVVIVLSKGIDTAGPCAKGSSAVEDQASCPGIAPYQLGAAQKSVPPSPQPQGFLQRPILYCRNDLVVVRRFCGSFNQVLVREIAKSCSSRCIRRACTAICHAAELHHA